MVTKEQILELFRTSFLSPVLRFAEAALPERQYLAYRRLVLDQSAGFGRELDKLFPEGKQRDRQGTGGPIPRKEDGAL